MKKEDVPQDQSNLSKSNVRELVYAIDENGNYTTALSSGWDPKTIALNNAMEDINERVTAAQLKIRQGQASPILYFMERDKMDLGILASYVGLWQWRVKRHLKPKVFNSLSDSILQKYADAFEITVADLKNYTPD